MPEWQVKLKGEPLDLSSLAEALDSPEMTVREEQDGCYLRSNRFVSLTDSDEVEAQAVTLLPVINGVAKTHFGNAEPVGVDRVVLVNEDGSRRHFVKVSAVIRFRARVSASATVDGESVPLAEPPNRLRLWVEIACQRPEVARAVRFFGQGTNWYDLYKVLEVIAEDAGGSQAIVARGWATKAEIDRFTGSANNYLTTGDGARHAHTRWKPMKQKAMSLANAETFIRTLLEQWLATKQIPRTSRWPDRE